jgi:uncharacterized membrane protein
MTMNKKEREHDIHTVFLAAVILKGLNGLLELALAIFLATSDEILPYILNLANDELIENPNDFLAHHLSAYTHPSESMLLFASLYLTVHGFVKIALALGLWLNKIWAYPAAMGIISLFIVFQLIRVLEKGSMLLLALTLVDCVFVWLIYHEYKNALTRDTMHANGSGAGKA